MNARKRWEMTDLILSFAEGFAAMMILLSAAGAIVN